MYPFLDEISKDKLRKYLRKKYPAKLVGELDTVRREDIYRALFSVHGFDILYDKEIRLLLLLTLHEAKLLELSKSLNLHPYSKSYDLAVSISSERWRIGSHLTWCFAELFSIPLKYLPIRSQQNDSIETIEPYVPPDDIFDYQGEMVSTTLSLLLKSSKKACLLQLPTGAGKTRTAMEVLVYFLNQKENSERQNTVLWLAHTEELCEQAIESFRRIWQKRGQYGIRLVRLWGDYRAPVEEMAGAIVVGGYQKLVSLMNRSKHEFLKLKSMLRIVVIDEAHKALAPTIGELLRQLRSDKDIHLIGLTATPGRGKERYLENRRIAQIFDKTLISSTKLGKNPIKELQARGVLARLKRVSKSTKKSYSLSGEEKRIAEFTNDVPTSVLNKLARDNSRNKLIVSLVVEQVRAGNPTLVFACTVEHARNLAIAVALRGYRTASVDYKMRRNMRQLVISAFRQGEIDALFNFGVLSTGFDAPNIGTLIIARPTTSIVLYSQMIGRGLRGSLVGGTKQCNLIDVKDNFEDFGDVDNVYTYFDQFWSV